MLNYHEVFSKAHPPTGMYLYGGRTHQRTETYTTQTHDRTLEPWGCNATFWSTVPRYLFSLRGLKHLQECCSKNTIHNGMVLYDDTKHSHCYRLKMFLTAICHTLLCNIHKISEFLKVISFAKHELIDKTHSFVKWLRNNEALCPVNENLFISNCYKTLNLETSSVNVLMYVS